MKKLIPLLLLLPLIAFAAERSDTDTSDGDTPISEDETAKSEASCGGKSKCGEMASCAEAQHYLNDCGLSRLDRDHDGVPCESLCK